MAQDRERPSHCRNCDTALTGDYCHVCGQRGVEPRAPVIGLAQDVLVDTFAIEGRLARTFALLMMSPGRLAREYLDGKRVRYTPPFRLFLFSSVLFFLVIFSLIPVSRPDDAQTGDNGAQVELGVEEEADPEAPAEIIEQGVFTEDGAIDKSFTEKTWDDVNYDGPPEIEQHLERLFASGQNLVRDPRLFIAQTRTLMPRFLLLAPVLYAFLLTLLYFYRRKFLAYDHFVVSLYMHAALYALLTLSILISFVPVIGDLSFVPILWGALQPFRVLKGAYGSGIVSVVLKGLISQTLYWVGTLIIFGVGLSYTLYQS